MARRPDLALTVFPLGRKNGSTVLEQLVGAVPDPVTRPAAAGQEGAGDLAVIGGRVRHLAAAGARVGIEEVRETRKTLSPSPPR
jgi:hypothetical protein